MSDAVSALNGARFDGLVSIADLGPRGMITLRGDLSSAAVKKAVKAVTGTATPEQRKIVLAENHATAWMSPDELLLITPYGETSAAIAAAEKALAKQHSMVAEVSDARASFSISGNRSREVLAKLIPVDLSPGAFGVGEIRRTHCAQVPAAVWMTEPDSFELVCFRSVAQYVFDLLKAAAAEGSEVDAF